jgi:hypothetical protein
MNQGVHLDESERYAITIKGSQASIQHEAKAFDHQSWRNSKL